MQQRRNQMLQRWAPTSLLFFLLLMGTHCQTSRAGLLGILPVGTILSLEGLDCSPVLGQTKCNQQAVCCADDNMVGSFRLFVLVLNLTLSLQERQLDQLELHHHQSLRWWLIVCGTIQRSEIFV